MTKRIRELKNNECVRSLRRFDTFFVIGNRVFCYSIIDQKLEVYKCQVL